MRELVSDMTALLIVSFRRGEKVGDKRRQLEKLSLASL
jgi:hypothetical protein